MFFLLISSLLCIFMGSTDAFYDRDAPIQFPLRNVEHSIDLSRHSSSESNQTYEFENHLQQSNGYSLNLPNLGLKEPPNPFPGFIVSKQVTFLNLRQNGIYRISPDSFDTIPNLQYLDFSKNNLAFCDFFDYGNCLESLQTLVIEENVLPTDSINHEISRAGCFPQVHQIYIRKNHIRKINFPIKTSFPSLQSLYLSDNELDTCDFIRDIPESLTHLYIERNHVASVSVQITRNLHTLAADNNLIKSICYKKCDLTSLKLHGASKLEVLSLSHNNIAHVEFCSFRDTHRLRCINLSHNNIQVIQESTFAAALSLTQLNLDNNLLECMPDVSSNRYLTSLSLRNNKLTEIKGEHFGTTSTLETLLLGGNRISQIHCDTFDRLTWLQKLDLSGNSLRSLPHGWMKGLVNLKHLDLRNNLFTCVPDFSFSSSISMSDVYLQHNGLRESTSLKSYFPYAQIHLFD